MRTYPIYGRGTAFPFRANPATGGVQVTEGLRDPRSVSLQYLNESWTIRENTDFPANHIAEAIAHILLTHQGEHDTLPEFGSRIQEILFEPNSSETWPVLKHFFFESTIRWEKRARFPENGGMEFKPSGYGIDQGQLPALAYVEFILAQIVGNLVAPFVEPRQARAQEYPVAAVDASRHDYQSRYFNIRQSEYQGITHDRFRRSTYLPPNYDDKFYEINHGDTWLLISWKLYGDIRYWPYLAQMWVQDAAEAGMSRHNADPSEEPPVGTLIRVPSQARLLTEVATLRN